MAKSKIDPRREMVQARDVLKEIMRRHLAAIADSMITQVIVNVKALIPSQRFDATKDITPTGLNEYKAELLEALAVIAGTALERARKEVPKAKSVKLSESVEGALLLGEFDKLPPDIRKRIKRQNDLLVGQQISDIEKSVFFQFQHSIDSTDSVDQIQGDLFDSAEEYIDGAAVEAGAMATGSQVISESRSAFFFEPDVLDEIIAFEFVNGDPVSPICIDLAGTVFAKDDPELGRYTPPLHWNCKSWIRPLVAKESYDDALKRAGQEDVEPLKPSKESLNKYVQFAERAPCSCDHFTL